ncbi:hypothetical protein [Paenibacillus polymyxa]|uniref:Uncharacterized protein n=1 Tax=Paenibacillus polymyxa (strain SC2) TaxID=886882 RepID=E3EK39_PAEPS|nr:hypothetical protein [Paenibacillus polymyxa]ADO59748.1 hypothetical protein PPSC2_26440 [Paenibacillus polymyxa SC2]WPQ60018.1 hypothetical protein SKN87_27635 [Paenibacillus polymyxa]
MRKRKAIQMADQKGYETGLQHFVIWDPETIREAFTFSGYQVKSEKEMIEDYGSVEECLLYIAYLTRQVS